MMATIVWCSSPKEAYTKAREQARGQFSEYEDGFETHTANGICEVIITKRSQPTERLIFVSPAA